MKNVNYRLITRDMVLIALFVALITVCSWITIPLVVPITLQTLAIFIAVGFLGPIKGLITIALYLALGMIGVPVFSSFNAGLAAIMGPTGGFLIGFIIVPFVFMLFNLTHLPRNLINILSMLVALILIYLFGSIWFYFVYSARNITFTYVLSICVVPFIAPDILKIIIATLVLDRIAVLFAHYSHH